MWQGEAYDSSSSLYPFLEKLSIQKLDWESCPERINLIEPLQLLRRGWSEAEPQVDDPFDTNDHLENHKGSRWLRAGSQSW